MNAFDKFYKKTVEERHAILAEYADLNEEEQAFLASTGALSFDKANHMIENTIGIYSLPLGLGMNMLLNDKRYVVPMAMEEPSVVAAQSAGAKLIAQNGGITGSATKRKMIGQIELISVSDIQAAKENIIANEEQLIAIANQAHPSLQKRGGGAVKIQVRTAQTANDETLFIVHLLVDTQEAMGANMVNTMVETLAPELEMLTNGTANMRILSNLVDEATATAVCRINPESLATKTQSGEWVRDRIIAAYEFADADIYRAATHNKGIMNGIDAVIMAFGNDWRAVEAASHAYAARTGSYKPMSKWSKDADGYLVGELTLPMPVAFVGGSIAIHPIASLSKKIARVESAKELAMLVCAVGLTQNLAALKALVTEGIQRGHMSLQAKSLAMTAGAEADEIEIVATFLQESKQLNVVAAKEFIAKLRSEK
ncbi:hydroxymethylglutaryl-CoA reductase, degradative [Listeria monocytogenes]|jgi:hydroxymethylglutaryl-CoA reductase, degradative|uniref:3-hydroxy-3-methylglutaryl coenzyme A reductase n=5 Tax=Listeria monocytogenes TaxID=1639 RepID=Q8Y8R9_LISMO|nr:hydroxymethylglutaryl-CoA reductase, degradative [Listeria monocytogenes]NP_464352.1 3-hydroxy-3-methylglutaryl-CoA reductase [Listeria monocytogenes EGD-e]EAA0164733.1 hydroxymethylglutaryl-CoA reductase, degradative [Listeria monocytogenes serotype 1/2a]EAE3702665.1 hydroxymethylglutaryl-CoA reductase, degradative [Listeria monocytogenes serotype 1/2c]EAE6023480.1 hydroxymethylglutaryl-CoA reductase, degradative [Listeria monocytogenes serotype 3a]EAF4501290.1 hydroxymethylglutaryl-CoA re